MTLLENYEKIKADIEVYGSKFGHKPEDITLLAVTKTVDEDRIRQAIELGITDIGENRVQEINRKIDAFSPARIHMIGRLQSNKVRQLPDDTYLIHSLDRVSLFKEMERIGKRDQRHFNCLVQVNMAGEKQKGGMEEEELDSFFDMVEEASFVKVKGLMFIAPLTDDPEDVRLYFKKMHLLFEKIGKISYNNVKMEILSMGMTHDYKIALEEGSNMIRVGTGLFGQRNA